MTSGIKIEEIIVYILVFSAFIAVFYSLRQMFGDLKDTGLLSWLGPRWIAIAKLKKRKQLFESKILDLTMGLANAMKAGMALPQAIERIGSQMGGVMQEELSVTLHEYRLGMSIVDAMGRLYERMPCEDMRLLYSAIQLTTQSGGSLVDVLSQMVTTIRQRVDFHQKLLTLTAQGRFEALAMASAPLAAFLLLYFAQPELVIPLVTTFTGWVAIGAALTMEVIGYIVIRKIVTIEV